VNDSLNPAVGDLHPCCRKHHRLMPMKLGGLCETCSRVEPKTFGCQICCIRVCESCMSLPSQPHREKAVTGSKDGHLSEWISGAGSHQHAHVPVAKCKSFVRMVEKVLFESDEKKRGRYECLKDISRATIVCESTGVLLRVLAVFSCLDNTGLLSVVSGKNRFADPTSGGWADIMLNIVLPAPGTGALHICEIQLVHHRMLVVRTHLGAHSDYADFRAALELTEVLGLQVPDRFPCHSASSDFADTEDVRLAKLPESHPAGAQHSASEALGAAHWSPVEPASTGSTNVASDEVCKTPDMLDMDAENDSRVLSELFAFAARCQ